MLGWYNKLSKRKKVFLWIGTVFVGLTVIGGVFSEEPEPEVSPAQAVTPLPVRMPQPTVEPMPTATLTTEPTPTPTATPEPTPTAALEPTPTVTPSPPEATLTPEKLFLLWFTIQGYPASSYEPVVEFVTEACTALQGGASGEDAALIILLAAPEWATEMALILGAGVQAFCPDQSYKFK